MCTCGCKTVCISRRRLALIKPQQQDKTRINLFSATFFCVAICFFHFDELFIGWLLAFYYRTLIASANLKIDFFTIEKLRQKYQQWISAKKKHGGKILNMCIGFDIPFIVRLNAVHCLILLKRLTFFFIVVTCAYSVRLVFAVKLCYF